MGRGFEIVGVFDEGEHDKITRHSDGVSIIIYTYFWVFWGLLRSAISNKRK